MVKESRGEGSLAVPLEMDDVQFGHPFFLRVSRMICSMNVDASTVADGFLSAEVMLMLSNTSVKDLQRGDRESEREQG